MGVDPEYTDTTRTPRRPTWDYGGDLGDLNNGIGLSLSDVRTVSWRLNKLLELLNPKSRYKSISEADMNAVYLLRGWHFAKDDCIRILKEYRDREGRTSKHPEKMKRTDYAPRTVAAATERVDPIDPPLAHALVHSAKNRSDTGHGPLAGRETINTVLNELGDLAVECKDPPPYRTSRVTEKCGFSRRRTIRGLKIVNRAGYVCQIEGRNGYEWELTGNGDWEPWIRVTPTDLTTVKQDMAEWPHPFAKPTV